MRKTKKKYDDVDLFNAKIEAFKEGLEVGKKEERNKWIDSVLPKTAHLVIRVRDENDQVEAISQMITFDMIKEGREKIIKYFIEEAWLKIATAKIIRTLIEGSPLPAKEKEVYNDYGQ